MPPNMIICILSDGLCWRVSLQRMIEWLQSVFFGSRTKANGDGTKRVGNRSTAGITLWVLAQFLKTAAAFSFVNAA